MQGRSQQVENAFAAKLAVLQEQNAKSNELLSDQSFVEQTSAAMQINKSVLVFPEPRRVRDRDHHIRHLIKQPCLVCGRQPCDPHHLRFALSRALARKVSDEFTVPLCRAVNWFHKSYLERSHLEVAEVLEQSSFYGWGVTGTFR